MRTHFPAAPWPTVLKVTSALATAVLAGAGYAAYRAIPTATGFTHAFGLWLALVFAAIGVFSLLFMVTGYDLADGALYVQRPLWSTRIALVGLTRISHEAGACKGSLRIFGNGGLYSFTGLYQSRALGRYRLFGTDLSRAVVLALPGRVVVVTPEAPGAFIEHVHGLLPGAKLEPEERSRI